MPPNTQTFTPTVRVQKSEREKTSEDIRKFQASKEDSIKIQSSGRDAVLLTVAKMRYKDMTDEEIQSEVTRWARWMHDNIYSTPFI